MQIDIQGKVGAKAFLPVYLPVNGRCQMLTVQGKHLCRASRRSEQYDTLPQRDKRLHHSRNKGCLARTGRASQYHRRHSSLRHQEFDEHLDGIQLVSGRSVAEVTLYYE